MDDHLPQRAGHPHLSQFAIDSTQPINKLASSPPTPTDSRPPVSAAPQLRRSRPRVCGRRRRHTISNNHIEFVIYHCLRDDGEGEEEESGGESMSEEGRGSGLERVTLGRRTEQHMVDVHHCDVIVLKTDNGWCFDQDIFLPAWKRDAYETDGHHQALDPQELVKVDEIRLD